MPSTSPPPYTPVPPYFKPQFVSPTNFKAAVNSKLDKPAVSLFRLTIRILQFAFALASGISYAIELNQHVSKDARSSFIYTQFVFGATLFVLVLDSVTVRHYRFTWLVEWVLAIFYFAAFATFYQAYLEDGVGQGYENVDLGRMKRAIWCDLINALLWSASALFSTVMCCSGIKAAVKGKMERRRQRKQGKKGARQMEEMESGTMGSQQV